MPVSFLNVINERGHAGNKLAMQEFMFLPTRAACFSEAMRMGSKLYIQSSQDSDQAVSSTVLMPQL